MVETVTRKGLPFAEWAAEATRDEWQSFVNALSFDAFGRLEAAVYERRNGVDEAQAREITLTDDETAISDNGIEFCRAVRARTGCSLRAAYRLLQSCRVDKLNKSHRSRLSGR